jgi:hypothetical protein
VFIGIDSLLRPVYGHAKQGASYGHTKVAGTQIPARDCPRWRPRSAPRGGAPVIAGMRLRAGKTGSAKGAGRMVAQATSTARAAGASGQPLVRGDSAYGNRKVVTACVRHDAQFSLVMTRNPEVDRALAAIDETAWTRRRIHPTGSPPRLVSRRVKDARFPDALFPVWRHHPFFTNTDLPTAEADSPTATTRSSKPCSPESDTAGRVARPCGAASSTSQPDSPVPNVDRFCIYPATVPGSRAWLHCGATLSGTAHQTLRSPDPPAEQARPQSNRSWADQQ